MSAPPCSTPMGSSPERRRFTAPPGRRCSTRSSASTPRQPASRSCPSAMTTILRYVDGRARSDGVEAFLASRGIHLPRGDPDDPPDRTPSAGSATARISSSSPWCAIEVSNRSKGPPVRRRLRELRVPTAVVSASENCAAVLEAAGASDLFDVRVDGVDAARLGLPASPIRPCSSKRRGVSGPQPRTTAVVEDAYAGVEAGRARRLRSRGRSGPRRRGRGAARARRRHGRPGPGGARRQRAGFVTMHAGGALR